MSENEGDGSQDVKPTTKKKRQHKGKEEYETFLLRDDIPQGVVSPPGLTGHSVAKMGGKVLIFGGTDHTHIYADTWLYCESTQRWRKLRCKGNSPLGRHSHTAQIYKGKMYVYGGFGLGGVTVKSQSNSALSPAKQLLNITATEHTTPSKWQSAEEGYQMIKCGLLSTLYCLDLTTLEWSELQTPTDDHIKDHTGVVYKGRMYFFGGNMLEKKSNVVRVFDCDGVKWCPLAHYNSQLFEGPKEGILNVPVPTVRSGHTASIHRGGMLIFGGQLSKHAYSNEVFKYSFATRQWTQYNTSGQHPPSRHNHAAVTWGGKLFVYGGSAQVKVPTSPAHNDNPTVAHFGDCFVLTMASMVWREVPLSCSVPLSSHTMCITTDTKLLLTSYGGVSTDDHGKDVVLNIHTFYEFASAAAPHSPPPPYTPHPPPTRRPSPPASPPRSPCWATPPSRPTSGKKEPWVLGIAHNAALFGELDVRLHDGAKMVTKKDLGGIVNRLYDTRKQEMRMQQLYDKYMITQKGRNLTRREETRTVERLYKQANDAAVLSKNRLLGKYLRERKKSRMSGDAIGDMVERLHYVPARKTPKRAMTVKVSEEETIETVNRLFYKGVENSAATHSALVALYCPEQTGQQISHSRVSNLVGRLYTPRGKPGQ